MVTADIYSRVFQIIYLKYESSICTFSFASGKFSSQLCSADFVRFGTPIGGRVSCGSGGSTGALDDGDDYELEQTAMASTGGAGVDPENWY